MPYFLLVAKAPGLIKLLLNLVKAFSDKQISPSEAEELLTKDVLPFLASIGLPGVPGSWLPILPELVVFLYNFAKEEYEDYKQRREQKKLLETVQLEQKLLTEDGSLSSFSLRLLGK